MFTIITSDPEVTLLLWRCAMAKDTKERILESALEMFSKKGYEATNGASRGVQQAFHKDIREGVAHV